MYIHRAHTLPTVSARRGACPPPCCIWPHAGGGSGGGERAVRLETPSFTSELFQATTKKRVQGTRKL